MDNSGGVPVSAVAAANSAVLPRWRELLVPRRRQLHEFYYAVLLAHRPLAAAIFFTLWFYFVHIWVERVMSSVVWMASTVLFVDACARCVSHGGEEAPDATDATNADTALNTRYRVWLLMAERVFGLVRRAAHALIHMDDAVLYAPEVAAILPSVEEWVDRLAGVELQLRHVWHTAYSLRARQPLFYAMWAALVYVVGGVLGYLLPNAVLLFVCATVPVIYPFLSHHYRKHMALLARVSAADAGGSPPFMATSTDTSSSREQQPAAHWQSMLLSAALHWWRRYEQATVLPDSFHPSTPQPPHRPMSTSSSFAILSPTYWSKASESAENVVDDTTDDALQSQQLPLTDMRHTPGVSGPAAVSWIASAVSLMSTSLSGESAATLTSVRPRVTRASRPQEPVPAASDDDSLTVEDGFTYLPPQHLDTDQSAKRQ